MGLVVFHHLKKLTSGYGLCHMFGHCAMHVMLCRCSWTNATLSSVHVSTRHPQMFCGCLVAACLAGIRLYSLIPLSHVVTLYKLLSIVAHLFEQLTGLVYQIWLHLTGFTHCAWITLCVLDS